MNLSQLIKRRLLCPNLDTISVSRNVLHHNNDNVGKTGNTWLTTLSSDLLGVWQSVFHMMFVSHKQFQHGTVWCQDNSRIIRHCRTSVGLAKKVRFFYLGLLISTDFLVVVSHQHAVLSFETWPSPPLLCVISIFQEGNEVRGRVSTGNSRGKRERGGGSGSQCSPWVGGTQSRELKEQQRHPHCLPAIFEVGWLRWGSSRLPPFS